MTSRNWKSLKEHLPQTPTRGGNDNAPTTNAKPRSSEKFNGCLASTVTKIAADTLRTGEAAICIDCRGSGKHGSYGRCERCNGKGCVCPACSGMRFVRLRQRGQEPWAAEVTRCSVCCEGNNVNEVNEIRAIRAYIARSDALEG